MKIFKRNYLTNKKYYIDNGFDLRYNWMRLLLGYDGNTGEMLEIYAYFYKDKFVMGEFVEHILKKRYEIRECKEKK